jgi:hypothetical protein
MAPASGLQPVPPALGFQADDSASRRRDARPQARRSPFKARKHFASGINNPG